MAAVGHGGLQPLGLFFFGGRVYWAEAETVLNTAQILTKQSLSLSSSATSQMSSLTLETKAGAGD